MFNSLIKSTIALSLAIVINGCSDKDDYVGKWKSDTVIFSLLDNEKCQLLDTENLSTVRVDTDKCKWNTDEIEFSIEEEPVSLFLKLDENKKILLASDTKENLTLENAIHKANKLSLDDEKKIIALRNNIIGKWHTQLKNGSRGNINFLDNGSCQLMDENNYIEADIDKCYWDMGKISLHFNGEINTFYIKQDGSNLLLADPNIENLTTQNAFMRLVK